MLYLPDHTLFFKLLFGVRLLLFKLFSDSASLCYTFCGFNKLFGYRYCKIYNDNDHIRANVIRNLLMFGGSADVIDPIACS